MRSSGTTGCAMYQRVPSRPTSSPVVAAKTTVRFGGGPRGERLRDLEHRHDARGIVVGAVVDGVAVRPAGPIAEWS